MNTTLIIYASRHGTTANYAKQLLQYLEGNVDLYFLNSPKDTPPNFNLYKTLIIGGSIHYGKNNKLIIDFINQYNDILKTKKLGLFVSSYYEGEKAQQQLQNAYPSELLKQALVADYFDGELIFPKMNFWEKIIARLVLRAEERKPVVSQTKLINFAHRINETYR